MCQDSGTGDIIVRCNADTPNTREEQKKPSHWLTSETLVFDWMIMVFLDSRNY